MKHYILVKWNKEVTNKEEMVKRVNEAFKDVIYIDGVNSLTLYPSISEKENRYDIMILITCSLKGLNNYDKSSLHQNWKANYSQFIESKAIFDCQ